MRRWGWLAICLTLIAAGGGALYLAGFREIVVYELLLVSPLLFIVVRGQRGRGAPGQNRSDLGGRGL